MSGMPNATAQLAEIVKLLGRLWLFEVNQSTLDSMCGPVFREPYESLGGELPDVVSPELVEQLAIEYCELLIGPKGHISPVQSIWADDQYQAATAASMSRFFDVLPGYCPQSSLQDHLGVQFDYLSELMRLVRDPEQGEVVREVIQCFVDDHLSWSLPMFEKIVSQTHSSFYRGLAIVSANFVKGVLPQLNMVPTSTD